MKHLCRLFRNNLDCSYGDYGPNMKNKINKNIKINSKKITKVIEGKIFKIKKVIIT